MRRCRHPILVSLLASVVTFAPVSVPAAPTGKGADRHVELSVSPQSEQLIQGGLKYLVSKQLPSGSWSGGNHQAAFTGYVLLSFMAAGHLPNEGEHGQAVARGVQFLLDCVRPDGYIAAPTGDSNMYGHGIAAIALGEVYGQTRDSAIRAKLERAVKLIIASQNKQGGWRYRPVPADADISVTVLQVVALRVAKNAGIQVPQETIDRAIAYVRSCQDEKTGGFTYQPRNNKPGFARTAAAIYSLQMCGVYDDPMIDRGAEYMFAHVEKTREWFSYGNFYAAPAMYMVGGEQWKRWYGILAPRLEKEAKREGDLVHWKPIEGNQGGINEVYATAVYTMILAMPYDYLPLYQR